jgi:starch synthase
MAHRILAGSDVLLVPSFYEPCGMTQLYALRYGTVPVVRHTGGLADTIRHFDPVTGQGNGSVFRDFDAGGLAWGLSTALGWHRDRTQWRRLMQNGMADDFSWARQGPLYAGLYARLASGRGAAA